MGGPLICIPRCRALEDAERSRAIRKPSETAVGDRRIRRPLHAIQDCPVYPDQGDLVGIVQPDPDLEVANRDVVELVRL
jgi:hypothetical protein